MLRCIGIAVRIAMLAARVSAGAEQQRQFRIEPPHQYLVADHALFGDDFQQSDGIAITPAIHFADDQQQIPHAFRFATAQWP